MARVLYVTCNLKPVERSRSLSVGKEFLDDYLKYNPDDEVQMLDLYRDNIQRIDADVLSGWGKMRNGESFASLASDEQRKIGRIWSHADQFVSADKCVFVTSMFNLGFPAEFKMYIDSICVVGKTFVYTPTGPVGLLKNRGRKCLNIHANGGFHFGKAEDHSVPYLKSILGFMGIEEFESVVIEGTDAIPERAEEFKQHAISRAKALARTF